MSRRVSSPDPLALIERLGRGELTLADVLRMLPDPPRLAPAINRLIDEALHPLAERNKAFYIVDSLLHTIVEVQDTLVHSLVKTLRYNVSRMLEGGGRG